MIALKDDGLLLRVSSYLEPDAWYESADLGSALARRAISSKSPADFSDVEVVREFATSKDGTRVPLNIIRRKGTMLDGKNPAILTGYGGYGLSQRPAFQAINKIWLEAGGILVVANIRGGSEFGEEWHKAGMLTSKQNVFDDFIAAAEYLIAHKYTSPQHLAIRGGSNGGLLMGAALTQRPELFKAVVSHVGIYDMVRVELSPNGSFNVPEFGTVTDADQFQAIFKYSPYHHVKDGAKYPSVLFLTGANDPRVDPMHSRKMTARLQSAGGRPDEVLLRTSAAAGHGIGTTLSEVIEQDVDVYAFLFATLK
jgi:prolyl oligopeptidase